MDVTLAERAFAGSARRQRVAIMRAARVEASGSDLRGLPLTGALLHPRMTRARGDHHPEVTTESGTGNPFLVRV